MKVLLCTTLLLTAGIALAQPLETGTVPNDKYTAAPAPPPLGSEGWLTGRSTFFDGSDSFKNAYLARCANIAPADFSLLMLQSWRSVFIMCMQNVMQAEILLPNSLLDAGIAFVQRCTLRLWLASCFCLHAQHVVALNAGVQVPLETFYMAAASMPPSEMVSKGTIQTCPLTRLKLQPWL